MLVGGCDGVGVGHFFSLTLILSCSGCVRVYKCVYVLLFFCPFKYAILFVVLFDLIKLYVLHNYLIGELRRAIVGHTAPVENLTETATQATITIVKKVTHTNIHTNAAPTFILQHMNMHLFRFVCEFGVRACMRERARVHVHTCVNAVAIVSLILIFIL